MMALGSVKWFGDKKGYGFIGSQDGDYFVHFKYIMDAGFKTLKEGQKVSFTPKYLPKGKTAIDVSVLLDCPP
jgi:CspA family cold shock protein